MSLGDLLRAGVGGDDGLEMWSQSEGRLTVAGGTVPGEVVVGGERGEEAKEGVRVPRAIRLVVVCGIGEVIVEDGQELADRRSIDHDPERITSCDALTEHFLRIALRSRNGPFNRVCISSSSHLPCKVQASSTVELEWSGQGGSNDGIPPNGTRSTRRFH